MDSDFNVIREKLAGGCSEDEFKAMRCPMCGGPLLLMVHPTREKMSVRCHTAGHTHMHIKANASPEWLSSYVGGAWF